MSYYPYPFTYPYDCCYPPHHWQERKHKKHHRRETEERLRKKVDKKKRELQEQDETIQKLMYMPNNINNLPIDMNAQMIDNNTTMLMNKMNEVSANFLAIQNSILLFDERLKSLEANFNLNCGFANSSKFEERIAFLENKLNIPNQCDEQRIIKLENDLKESNQIVSQIVNILKGMKNESEQREMMTIKLIKETELKIITKILNVLQNNESKDEEEQKNENEENDLEVNGEDDITTILKNPNKVWGMLLSLQNDYQELSAKYQEILSTADMDDPEVKKRATQISQCMAQLEQTILLLYGKMSVSEEDNEKEGSENKEEIDSKEKVEKVEEENKAETETVKDDTKPEAEEAKEEDK